MKLHIGGEEIKDGWSILNIQEGPGVDYLGTCTDLSQFSDNSIEAIYASHVFEHLGYRDELPRTLAECYRVLESEGQLMISVPNFGLLCQLFVAEGLELTQRFKLMRIIFGGQQDDFDFHKVGLIEDFLRNDLGKLGFSLIERVEEFNLFNDSSSQRLGPHLISLNMIATK